MRLGAAKEAEPVLVVSVLVMIMVVALLSSSIGLLLPSSLLSLDGRFVIF